jgi:hypothetical protein
VKLKLMFIRIILSSLLLLASKIPVNY